MALEATTRLATNSFFLDDACTRRNQSMHNGQGFTWKCGMQDTSGLWHLNHVTHFCTGRSTEYTARALIGLGRVEKEKKETRPHVFPLPILHGERARVRGG